MSIIQQIHRVHTLDLGYRGTPQTIASYLIPHQRGVLLIECGPESTLQALKAGLTEHGFDISDITDVFVTHIHLDHAGAAGSLARQGATIHVHPVGAPHLLDPEKLLSSAKRIYGDSMETLWGKFLPVPEDRLSVLQDNQSIEVGGVKILPLNTPGHAWHHFAYISEGICFSGDIGGVRLGNTSQLRIPSPPPEFHLEEWRASIKLLQEVFSQDEFTLIAPTHFGIFEDPDQHLQAVKQTLDAIESWMEEVMPGNPTIEELNDKFVDWTAKRSQRSGIRDDDLLTLETANPSWMSPLGLWRYWRKYRTPE